MNALSGLAYIGKIMEVTPIDGADKIERAVVNCVEGGVWEGVVPKGEYAEDDHCEVYLHDALVPATERFSFMKKHKYRVRIHTMRGARSECLIMPVTDLTEPMSVGMDITQLCDVYKYEKPIAASMWGTVRGPFPSFIPKTDEIMVQKAADMLKRLQGRSYYISIKYDGTSVTFYKRNGVFHVCSRNNDLHDDGGSVYWVNNSGSIYWQIARDYGLVDHFLNDLAIQGEIIGPKIQKNPLGLDKRMCIAFNRYSIADRKYEDYLALQTFASGAGMQTPSVVDAGDAFDYDMDALIDMASQMLYPNGKAAEGIVVRETQAARPSSRISFKVLNPNY